MSDAGSPPGSPPVEAEETPRGSEGYAGGSEKAQGEEEAQAPEARLYRLWETVFGDESGRALQGAQAEAGDRKEWPKQHDLEPERFDRALDEMHYSGWISNQAGKKLRSCEVRLQEGPPADHTIGNELSVFYHYINHIDGGMHPLSDWVGLFEIEDSYEEDLMEFDKDANRTALKYVPKLNGGELSFSDAPLVPGRYQFRYYLNGMCLAASSRIFKTVLPATTITVPSVLDCGSHLDVTYKVELALEHNPRDYICIRAAAQAQGSRMDDTEIIRMSIPRNNEGKIRVLTQPRFPGMYVATYHLAQHKGLQAGCSNVVNVRIAIQNHPAITREVRLFLSATIPDMRAERENLYEHVFPKLRALCQDFGAVFTVVDVNDGSDAGTNRAWADTYPTSSLRFAEIEKCRPYFLCMLGERYGHVPKDHPEELLRRYPWLQTYGNKHLAKSKGAGASLTELDVANAVLVAPSYAGSVLLFLRKNSQVLRVGAEYIDLTETGVADEEKVMGASAFHRTPGDLPVEIARNAMNELKERIRAVVPDQVREYSSVTGPGRTLCVQALEHLSQSIREQFGAPPEHNLTMLMCSHLMTMHMMKGCDGVWQDRGGPEKKLVEYMKGKPNGKVLVVAGPQGNGKSAMIAYVKDRLLHGKTLDRKAGMTGSLSLVPDHELHAVSETHAHEAGWKGGLDDFLTEVVSKARRESVSQARKGVSGPDVTARRLSTVLGMNRHLGGELTIMKEIGKRLFIHEMIGVLSEGVPALLRRAMISTSTLLGFSSFCTPPRDSELTYAESPWLEGLKWAHEREKNVFVWILNGLEHLNPSGFLDRYNDLEALAGRGTNAVNGMPAYRASIDETSVLGQALEAQIDLVNICAKVAEHALVIITMNENLKQNLPTAVLNSLHIIEPKPLVTSQRSNMVASMLAERKQSHTVSVQLREMTTNSSEDFPRPYHCYLLTHAIASLSEAHTMAPEDDMELNLYVETQDVFTLASIVLERACRLHPMAKPTLCCMHMSAQGMSEYELVQSLQLIDEGDIDVRPRTNTPGESQDPSTRPTTASDTATPPTTATPKSSASIKRLWGASERHRSPSRGGLLFGQRNHNSNSRSNWDFLRLVAALEDFGICIRMVGRMRVLPMFQGFVENFLSDANTYVSTLRKLWLYFASIEPVDDERRIAELPGLAFRAQQLLSWAEKLEGRKAERVAKAKESLQELNVAEMMKQTVMNVKVVTAINPDTSAALVKIFGLDAEEVVSHLTRQCQKEQGILTEDILYSEALIQDQEASLARVQYQIDAPINRVVSEFIKERIRQDLKAKEKRIGLAVEAAKMNLINLRKTAKPQQARVYAAEMLSIARLAEGLKLFQSAEYLVIESIKASYGVADVERINFTNPRNGYEGLAALAINIFADLLSQHPGFGANADKERQEFVAKISTVDAAVRILEQNPATVGFLRADVTHQLRRTLHMVNVADRDDGWYLDRTFQPVVNTTQHHKHEAISQEELAEVAGVQHDKAEKKKVYSYKSEERHTHKWLVECGYWSWMYKDLNSTLAKKTGLEQPKDVGTLESGMSRGYSERVLVVKDERKREDRDKKREERRRKEEKKEVRKGGDKGSKSARDDGGGIRGDDERSSRNKEVGNETPVKSVRMGGDDDNPDEELEDQDA